MTTKLDDAITAILAGDNDRDEWTRLCVATIRLGHALAAFDDARRAYVAANPPPPGGWPDRWRPKRAAAATGEEGRRDG